MALADAKGNFVGSRVGIEALEGRQLFAFLPVGNTGILQATGATAVESAAATPDGVNFTRYATVLSATGGSVVPVTGVDSGTPGAPIALTVPAGSTLSNTDVAANTATGTFVTVYQLTSAGGQGGTDDDVYAALYSNGTIVGAPVRVNTTIVGNQTDPRVAMDGAGNYIVVWQSTTAGAGLVGRRFNADGSANGGEFTIFATGVEPNVAVSPNGVFAVAFANANGTFVQRYTAQGAANGAPIVLSTENFTEPGIGVTTNGGIITAWASTASGTRTIVARRFLANGAPNGAQFTVPTVTGLNQDVPDVAVDGANGFAIGYAQASTGIIYDQVGFRVYRSNGTAYDVEYVTPAGVVLAPDHRFGLAYRIAGTVHLAYALPDGSAVMQTFADDGTGNGGGGTQDGEVAVPGTAILIDQSGAALGFVMIIEQTSTQIQVTLNGVQTNYSRSGKTSIYVRGSEFNDYIWMKPSVSMPTFIYARAGGDTVYGSTGVDLIDGGDSGVLRDSLGAPLLDDNIFNPQPIPVYNAIQANAGNDYVYGGSGNDTVFGGPGADRLLGGPGINVLYGEDGEDTLVGGNRGDGQFGGAGNDRLEGNDGADNLDGGIGADTLLGGTGRDRLFGNNGADFLEGGSGNDVLNGGRGDDILFGNFGRDTLFGGQGFDTLRGGGIDDRFIFPGNGNGGFNNEDFTTDFTADERLDIYYYDLLDTLVSQATRILVK